jgi:hypothetical protein
LKTAIRQTGATPYLAFSKKLFKRIYSMSKCTLTPDAGAIAITCPYDDGWLAEFKSLIPYSDRKPKYNGKKFVGWLVAPRHGATVQNLCNKYFGEMPLLPQLAQAAPIKAQKILDVRYIGATKYRGDDERSAYGWVNGGWNVVFSETVLRAWFDAPATPDEQPTLYSVLACKRDATADELKSAYRRMVMQWHPDRCKEPNAQEQFLAVQHAYEVLTKNRERYDAGLALEASLRSAPKSTDQYSVSGYRSPLRCGLILCEGVEQMGLFQVHKILAWQDVTDAMGRTLVVSWKAGDDHFTEVWA